MRGALRPLPVTTGTTPLSVVVLISGGGTNLQALIDTAPRRGFRIAGVISNRPAVKGLARAAAAGIATRVVDHTAHPDRAGFDAALAAAIDAFAPDLVVLAGFMRILTPAFVDRYRGRMINIHPSLLPAFQGLHTHRRALEAGVAEHGASVHFVTAELDGGPVIAQARVAVEADDDEDRLAARVLAREHVLLPQVVEWFALGRLAMRDGRVWFDGTAIAQPLPC
ncbi:MAG: phosphoribosylglycinamide formyltransferase [Chromatiaceae bacterium]|nr:phosphoribosylglycinamide formyltransferase [Gammaproteobacteria bacterium]MCP5300954.1 phosphoribosylglycinamide formyltransferase [Chromatiaceae bacterium]MCP5421573.1 phosphoribosylglycinamide formyltransferase [Chromatiaceae bacterium]